MENRLRERNIKRNRRAMRVRKQTRGTSEKPRLSVFRSNRHVYAQIIDDTTHTTLIGMGTLSEAVSAQRKSKESAREIGRAIAKKAKEKNIHDVVFDRGRYKYHGIVQELAQGAREEGLNF